MDFINILKKYSDYVIVSGYVSILLGRTRSSEDVDLLIPNMNFETFNLLFNDLVKEGFECANTMNIQEAFDMWHQHAIRFIKKGSFLPNMEFKMILNDIQKYALDNKVKVVFGDNFLYISSLELQIPFKLSLISDIDLNEVSSDKDFEDAKHVYDYFKEDLNMERLLYFVRLLKVESKFDMLIGEK